MAIKLEYVDWAKFVLETDMKINDPAGLLRFIQNHDPKDCIVCLDLGNIWGEGIREISLIITAKGSVKRIPYHFSGTLGSSCFEGPNGRTRRITGAKYLVPSVHAKEFISALLLAGV